MLSPTGRTSYGFCKPAIRLRCCYNLAIFDSVPANIENGLRLSCAAVARRQEAKSFELRAATSLARLWQQQGKKTEARDLLVPSSSHFAVVS